MKPNAREIAWVLVLFIALLSAPWWVWMLYTLWAFWNWNYSITITVEREDTQHASSQLPESPTA